MSMYQQLVQNFKPQKALHLKDELAKKKPKLDGLFAIYEKYDGWDTTVIYCDGKFHAPLSSANNVIASLEWMAEQLNTKFPHKLPFEFIIKAEAYRYDTPFKVLNGLLNRRVGDYVLQDALLMVHDIVPLNKVIRLDERMRLVDHFVESCASLGFVRKAEVLGISEYNEKLWDRFFYNVLENAGEGIIAKRTAGVYEVGKRNSDVLKKKLEMTVDVLATELRDGVGDKGNPSLTLVCKRKNGAIVPVVIAKHSLIDKFLNDPKCVIGKVVTVRAMEEFENGTLRQPVFAYERPDKAVDDYE